MPRGIRQHPGAEKFSNAVDLWKVAERKYTVDKFEAAKPGIQKYYLAKLSDFESFFEYVGHFRHCLSELERNDMYITQKDRCARFLSGMPLWTRRLWMPVVREADEEGRVVKYEELESAILRVDIFPGLGEGDFGKGDFDGERTF